MYQDISSKATNESKKSKKKKVKELSSRDAFENFDPSSTANLERESFKRACMAEYEITSYEFYNNLIDFVSTINDKKLLNEIFKK